MMRSKLAVFGVFFTLLMAGCTNKPNSSTTSAPSTDANGQQVAAPAPTPPPAPVVIPAGTIIAVTLDGSLGSKSSSTGDSFTATVSQPVSVGGQIVIPKSSSATGTVVEAKAKGKVKGEARLKLALTKINVNGKAYLIETSMSATTSKGKGKRTAIATGGGAAVGALIGGLAGGGKGAAIGILAGGGAGFAGGALTGNSQIQLPAETPLNFQLTSPLTLN
jgi:hypothetical protein